MKKTTYLLASIIATGLSLTVTDSLAHGYDVGSEVCLMTCKALSNSATNTGFRCVDHNSKNAAMIFNVSVDQQKTFAVGNIYDLHGSKPHKILKVKHNKEGLVTEFEAASVNL